MSHPAAPDEPKPATRLMPIKTPPEDWKITYGRQTAHICAWIARRDAAGHSHRQTLQMASARFHGRRLANHPGKSLKVKVNTLYRQFRRYQAGGVAAVIPQYKAPSRPQENQATLPITLRYGNGRRMPKGLLRVMFIQRLFFANVMSLQEALTGAIALSGQKLDRMTCYGMLDPEHRKRLRQMYADRKKAASEEGKLLRDICASFMGMSLFVKTPSKNAPGRAGITGGIQPALCASNQSAIACPANAIAPGESGQDGKSRDIINPTPQPNFMPFLEVVIKSKAELQGFQQATDALERQIGAAKAAGKSYADMEAQLDRNKKVLADYKQAHNGVGDAFKSLNGELVNVIPGLGALQGLMGKLAGGTLGMVSVGLGAVAASLAVAKKGLDEFAESEKVMAKVQVALAQTGQLSEAAVGQVEELATALKGVSGIDDDRWVAVITRLTQFGATLDGMSRHTDAVKDLAGILSGDLESASLLIGKALQGNFEGFGRLGIRINENATQADKLAQAYGELARRGGGQLGAANETLSGKFHALSSNIKEVFKGIGAHIADTGILQRALTLAADSAGWFADKLGMAAKALPGLQNAALHTASAIDTTTTAIKNFNLSMDEANRQAGMFEKGFGAAAEQISMLHEGEEQIAGQWMQKELALVELAEKQKIITAEQAAAKRQEIENRYENERLARHKEFVEKLNALDKTALDKSLTDENGLRDSLTGVRKAISSGQANEKAKGVAGTAKQELDEREKTLDKAKTKLADDEAKLKGVSRFALPGVRSAWETEVSNQKAVVGDAQLRRDQAKKVYDEAAARVSPQQYNIESLTQMAAALQEALIKKVNENIVLAATTGDKIENRGVQHNLQAGVTKVGQQTRAIKTATTIQTGLASDYSQEVNPNPAANPYQGRMALPSGFSAENNQLQAALADMGGKYLNATTGLLRVTQRNVAQIQGLIGDIARLNDAAAMVKNHRRNRLSQ